MQRERGKGEDEGVEIGWSCRGVRMEMRKRAWRWETRWEGDTDGGGE